MCVMQPRYADLPARRRQRADWDLILELAEARPGEWVYAGQYQSTGTRAAALRRGLEPTFRSRPDGDWDLYVRLPA